MIRMSHKCSNNRGKHWRGAIINHSTWIGPTTALSQRKCRLAVVAILLCSLFPVAAQAETVGSIERFLRLKPRWPELVGVNLTLEGRYASIVGNTIRFKHCEIPFRVQEPLPQFSRAGRVLEVTGQLVEQDDKLEFIVESLKERPSDPAMLRRRQSHIKRDAEPQEWYDLAQWAMDRSRFYDDPELAEMAQSTFLFGIMAERRLQPATDADGLFRLADKMATFGMPAKLLHEYRHQAYHLLWDAAKRRGKTDLDELAERIAADLPDCKVPLPLPLPKLSENYWDNPIQVYHEADEAKRLRLHRIFYREIVLQRILSQAAPGGSNGFEIADRIEHHLPEMFDLAETYRDRELAFKLSNVASFRRAEVLALQEQFRRRKQPEQARQVIVDWLSARRERLRPDDAEGILNVSREYIDLLEDRSSAVETLIAAHRRNPFLKAIPEQLGRYGYTWKDGRWLPEGEAAERSADPVRQAMREGRVAEGMTPEQVRKTLGAPTSIVRAASAGHISEVWCYGDHNASRITIHFQRRSRQPDSRVVGISHTRP
jgi:hypothetical protein